MKIKFLFLVLLISSITFAQKGNITGTLTDKEANNTPLAFANAAIKGTSTGVTTDDKGKYKINIEPGNYTIVFSFVGYEPVEMPVTVKSGETVVINKALGSGGYKLEDVVIKSASKSKEKETALLLEQKKSVEIKQSIGAQELSRKGVSDVATAVTKTTGITKQEGSGNVFVRGLGDRYNSTTMNGLPVPSNNPKYKNMNLEIFSTDIVEYISIDKVYNNRFFGDFAGGNIDIVSKDYTGKGFLKLDITSRVNSNAISNNNLALQKGFNQFGFENRTIPSKPLNSYKFETLELENNTPFAGSFGISGGDSFSVGASGKLNFFATAAFDNEYTSIKNGAFKGGVNGAGVAGKDFSTYTNDSYSTNTTGMLNLGYKINKNHKINFNSLFINNSSNTLEQGNGIIIDLANDGNGVLRFSRFNKNTILINQLLGTNKLTERIDFNWKIAFNSVKADIPDRVQNIMNITPNGYVINSQSRPNNNRYFQYLTESELASFASLDYKLGKSDDGYKGKLTIGYSGRSKTSDFKATQFNFQTENGLRGTIVDPNNLDSFYNQQNFANGFFTIATFRGNGEVSNALVPQSYKGEQTINGGFANLEYKFNKLSAVFGIRYEMINQKINWNTQLGDIGKNNFDKPAVLPSLILKYELNDKQNLRLGFSKTYTLPQFKEKAPFVYEEFGQVYIGNKDIYASDDYNLDLKWEMFPNKEELISFTAFGKLIQNPINEIVINSSTNDISYINTGSKGTAFGAEVEYRKNIFSFDNKKLSAGLNASYLHTDQDLDNKKVEKETEFGVAFNSANDKFTGASDFLLNADISLLNQWNNKESNLNTTLAYTRFSDRINAIGTNDRGNIVEKAYGSLDLILKSKLTKNIGLGLVAKNLLDPTINRVQENKSGDVNVLTYKKGINLSLNINYQF